MLRNFLKRSTSVISSTTRVANYGSVAGTYNWNDPFQLESQLSSEERLVRDQANHFAQTRLLPRVLNAYRTETFDRSIMTEMGDLGLLGATIEGRAHSCDDECHSNL
jgi:hypothetical protein